MYKLQAGLSTSALLRMPSSFSLTRTERRTILVVLRVSSLFIIPTNLSSLHRRRTSNTKQADQSWIPQSTSQHTLQPILCRPKRSRHVPYRRYLLPYWDTSSHTMARPQGRQYPAYLGRKPRPAHYRKHHRRCTCCRSLFCVRRYIWGWASTLRVRCRRT